MKLIAVALVFVSVTALCQAETYQDVVKKWAALIEPHKAACIEESKVQEALATQASMTGEFPDQDALKCYTKCIVLKLNILNAAGDIDVNVFRKTLNLTDEILAESVVSTCAGYKMPDLCETAFGITKCVYRIVQTALKAN